jgi:hypothetical protein
MNALRMAALAAGLLLGSAAGCSSDGKSRTGSGEQSCADWCEGACTTLASCGTASESCVSDCKFGFDADYCAFGTPDRFTCAELGSMIEHAFQCASYCAAFCSRIPECGSFDGALCARGCEASPVLCNPAAVAARTCDQLKVEAREYEETARALSGGGDPAPRPPRPPSFSKYGMCISSFECGSGPARCSRVTNTCGGPCSSAADCFEGNRIDPVICSPEGVCTAQAQ